MDDLRKIKFTTWDFENVENELKTVTIQHEGFFHAWLIAEGSALALVERRDGKMFKVPATDIQFISQFSPENIQFE